MLGNFISHLLDSRFESVLEYLGMYLGIDNLVVLLVTFMGVSYSAKVYKHSDMSTMDDRDFSIMIPLQIPRKPDLVLYVWSNSESEGGEDEVIAGLTYNYDVVQVIGEGLLHSTLTYYYREIPGEL